VRHLVKLDKRNDAPFVPDPSKAADPYNSYANKKKSTGGGLLRASL